MVVKVHKFRTMVTKIYLENGGGICSRTWLRQDRANAYLKSLRYEKQIKPIDMPIYQQGGSHPTLQARPQTDDCANRCRNTAERPSLCSVSNSLGVSTHAQF